jgi:hypothetical protein
MVWLKEARKEQGFSYRDTELIDATRHGMAWYCTRRGTRCFEFRGLLSLRFVSERSGIAGTTSCWSLAFLESLALTSHTHSTCHLRSHPIPSRSLTPHVRPWAEWFTVDLILYLHSTCSQAAGRCTRIHCSIVLRMATRYHIVQYGFDKGQASDCSTTVSWTAATLHQCFVSHRHEVGAEPSFI